MTKINFRRPLLLLAALGVWFAAAGNICVAEPYLKRLYFDTILFDPRALRYLIDLWGAEHVVLGTDYAFDMGDYDPLGSIQAVKRLSAKERAAIAGGNAAKLLGIKRR
jgi:aminocarboxymuconate-semialdehyde decarboxylase